MKNTPQLIDSHAHVEFGAFNDDWKEVVNRAFEQGIQLVNVGTNLKTSKAAVDMAEKVGDGMWATIGIHPIHLAKDIKETASFNGDEYSFVTKRESFDKRDYFELAQHPKVVAIGESGLDFFHIDDFKGDDMTGEQFKELQREVFYEILGFAREVGKPHVFHCRDAYDEFVEMVKEFSDNSDGGSGDGYKVRGVVHCYTGNREQAQKILDLGLYIGFTGIVTFPNAKELQEVAKMVPLDRMLIETDSPYLAPQPVRGQRNEPMYVEHVAEKIAELKGISVEEVAEATVKNTIELFDLK